MADYTGTTSNDTVNHSGDTTAKSWDFSQGGSDTLTGGSAIDTFYLGNAFWTPTGPTNLSNDVINGGSNGLNTVELAGDYDSYTRTVFVGGHASTFTSSAQLVLASNAFKNISTLKLDEGTGFGYNIKFDAANFSGLGYATIDASALTTAQEIIDATACATALTFQAGSGNYGLTGGTGNDTFDLRNGVTTGDHVDGGAGTNTVYLNTIYGGGTLNLPDPVFTNVQEFVLYGARTYIVTAGDAQTPAGGVLRVTANVIGSTLHFDGSAESDGSVQVTGNTGNDVLTGGAGGDLLIGKGGSNTIDGGAGDDTLSGGADGASQTISGGDGSDTITVGAGSAFLDGGAGDDVFTVAVGAGNTVRLDGGDGSDTAILLIGQNQTITIDAVMLQNIEWVTLSYSSATATDSFSAVWEDGILSDGQVMWVSAFDPGLRFNFDGSAETHGDFIFELPGTNSSGGAGGTHWTGGAGDDIFFALNPAGNSGAANVWNGGAGIDTLDYTRSTSATQLNASTGVALGSGTVGDAFTNFEVYAFGAGDNSFTGAGAGETVRMLYAGKETVHANGGDDIIQLGATFDKFDLIDGGDGIDIVLLDGDYSAGLVLTSYTLANVEMLRLAVGHSYGLTMNDGNLATGQVLTVDGSALGAADMLSFNGAAEASGGFVVTGGAGNDVIEGGKGNDVLDGGAGIDTVSFAHATAGVTARLVTTTQNTVSDGTDRLLNFENLIGSAYADTLAGNSASNHLDGGAGADTMSGGKGDDFFVVDNAGDIVLEADGDGSDTIDSTVSFSLAGQYVEVLNLLGTDAINGTGNSLANRIVGNSAANILVGGDGSDRLDGGAGADTMKGGLGNDVYVVDNALDKIVENDGEGTDTVEAYFSYSIAGQYIEILKLMGTGDFTATGNRIANTLYGNVGNNSLNGGAGADDLHGGLGDDTYIIDDSGDHVFENAGEGTDTVQASVTFSIGGQYIENLVLTGSAAINGTGNSLDNILTGNGAANTLNGSTGNDALHGGLGSDTLTGGAGQDSYWFETALGSANIDTITDFSTADDTITLDRTIFTAIAADGSLDPNAFYTGTAAHDADDRIVYDSATGKLWYDADGNGAGSAVLFAVLSTHPALTAGNFFAVT